MTTVPKVTKKAAPKVCPECGVDMSTLNAYGHSLTHWPEYLDPKFSSKEARIRQEQTRNGGVVSDDNTVGE